MLFRSLIRSSRAAFDATNPQPFGLRTAGPVQLDFPAVMERMRKLRADLSPTDSAQRFTKLGVDVFKMARSIGVHGSLGRVQVSFRRSDPSAMVTFCLAKAAECRRWAELTADDPRKQAWLATEGQWFYLARSYESERQEWFS